MAHVGDCRAVLGTLDAQGTLHHVDLTTDHRPTDDGERARILATGAWIRPMQEEPYFRPARVYRSEARPRLGPGLTMGRSLGDLDADEVGIIATPEVSFRAISTACDRFLVLASDGLWEFLSSESVVEIVGGFLERGEPAIQAARFLIATAAFAWKAEEGDYRDDITAVVVYLEETRAHMESSVAPRSYKAAGRSTASFKKRSSSVKRDGSIHRDGVLASGDGGDMQHSSTVA
eukprot:CAMPEP_0115874366 /NCGR_PEP_ID=MMETSP0287-20121206/24502_1 /TAXON_ID=412157 /ORGANISM="Chrysochromulina rotalis, Strain UIO044" /LENGTH=232 /DNA_ID=CAMNT_0003329511 /DNA_START=1 /DNA_END=695 /DNA_ORIENTATION=+